MIHTELSLVPDEFESYQVGVDNQVTFCLKELRVCFLFVIIIPLAAPIKRGTFGKKKHFDTFKFNSSSGKCSDHKYVRWVVFDTDQDWSFCEVKPTEFSAEG